MLVVQYAQKEFFFLRPLPLLSWKMVGNELLNIFITVGFPSNIRYLRSNGFALASTEESQINKNFMDAKVEETVLAEIQQKVFYKLETEALRSQRNRNIDLFKKGCKLVSNFLEATLTEKSNWEHNYAKVKGETPSLEHMMNDMTPFPIHKKSTWLKKSKEPWLEYTEKKKLTNEASGLLVLSQVSVERGNIPSENNSLAQENRDKNLLASAETEDLDEPSVQTDDLSQSFVQTDDYNDGRRTERESSVQTEDYTEPSTQSKDASTLQQSSARKPATAEELIEIAKAVRKEVDEEYKNSQSSYYAAIRNYETEIPETDIYLLYNDDAINPEYVLIPSHDELIRKHKDKPIVGNAMIPMTNTGSQCFFNASVQLLLHLSDLICFIHDDIGNDNLLDAMEKKPFMFAMFMTGSMFKDACEKYRYQTEQQHADERKQAKPLQRTPLQHIKNTIRGLSEYREEDAVLFTQAIMNKWAEESEELKDIMEDVLAFEISDNVKFKTCEHEVTMKSSRNEKFFTMKVPTEESVLQDKRYNLGTICVQQLLNEWYHDRTITHNARLCQKCGMNRELKDLNFNFDKIGKYFMIHLNRYQVLNNGVIDKIHTQVDIDPLLNIFVNKDDGEEEIRDYVLNAVVCHEGESGITGHYTICCFESETTISEEGEEEYSINCHFLSDDKHVLVPEKDFYAYIGKRGYFLLYKRVEKQNNDKEWRDLNWTPMDKEKKKLVRQFQKKVTTDDQEGDQLTIRKSTRKRKLTIRLADSVLDEDTTNSSNKKERRK